MTLRCILSIGSFVYTHQGSAIGDAQDVICSHSAYERALASNSASMAARRLLDGVFTIEAIAACSISGMPPRGKGKAAYLDASCIKPHLSPKGVTAIIGESLLFQVFFQTK